jgi:hypothetical protein
VLGLVEAERLLPGHGGLLTLVDRQEGLAKAVKGVGFEVHVTDDAVRIDRLLVERQRQRWLASVLRDALERDKSAGQVTGADRAGGALDDDLQ